MEEKDEKKEKQEEVKSEKQEEVSTEQHEEIDENKIDKKALEEGLTVEAEANMLPIDEETGRREIPDTEGGEEE